MACLRWLEQSAVARARAQANVERVAAFNGGLEEAAVNDAVLPSSARQARGRAVAEPWKESKP